jgi:hypothetical protein
MAISAGRAALMGGTLAAIGGVGWMMWSARQPSAVPPQATGASAAGVCTTTAPPNLGTIASIIAPTNKAFISDYNVLSEAAWCTLLAINWAALGTTPTMNPDKTQPFGNCLGAGNDCPVVWETWPNAFEVYSASATPVTCGTGASTPMPQVHRLTMTGQNPRRLDPHAPKVAAVPGQPTMEVAQATGFVLPDKNNTQTNPSVIRYEARENPSTCTTVLTNGLNTTDGQLKFVQNAPSQGLPPNLTGSGGSPIQFPGSSFEVKPSWYVFAPSDNQAALGMVTEQGQISEGQIVPIGLTGLHILWKVFPNSSWFWMTFEYVGPSGATPPNAYFTPALISTVNTWYDPTQNNKQRSFNQPYTPPAPCTVGGQNLAGNPQPCDPVGLAANAANSTFQSALKGTPFGNYRLVGAQVAPAIGSTPTLLANNHIETDFGAQNNPATNNTPTSSCITCHYAAGIGPCTTTSNNQATRPPVYNPATQYTGGYFGDFLPSLYAQSQNPTTGPFVSTDFVWSVQEVQPAQKCP